MPALTAADRHGATWATVALLLGFGLVTALTAMGGFDGLDRAVHDRVSAQPGDRGVPVMRALAVAGSTEATLAILAGLALLAIPMRHLRGPLLIATAVLAAGAAVEVAGKVLLHHPMPEQALRDPGLVSLGTPSSYPSGHALRILVVGALVVHCAPRRWGRIVAGLVALIAAGVLASRLYLSAHWASDVAGGALLGLAGVPPIASARPARPAP